MFEVLDKQNAMRALRSNQPLLDKEVVGATQFIWQPQLSFADSANRKFIWTIQSLDFNHLPIVSEVPNGEGRSEPKVFIIATGTAVQVR